MKKHTLTELFKFFGSKSKVARILGISPQAVNNWGDQIPAAAAIQLEIESEGKIKAINMPVKLPRAA